MDLAVADGCAAAVGINTCGASGNLEAANDHAADILQRDDMTTGVCDGRGIRTADCIHF